MIRIWLNNGQNHFFGFDKETVKLTNAWQSDDVHFFGNNIHQMDVNDLLSSIFYTFNMEHPSDYKNRSLSVGDVVEVDDNFYAIEMIGWKNVTEDLMSLVNERRTPFTL